MKLFLTVLAGALFFVSCSDDEERITTDPSITYNHGILVLNEGNFNDGNASVSFIAEDFSFNQNNIFGVANNNRPLGDVAQSIGFYEDLAYVVINNSQKIEVVDRFTFKRVATITDQINNPRYIAFLNGKGYVTNWGDPGNPQDDYIAVIDLTMQTVSSKIPVVEGPEQIIENNGKLYVSHSGGHNFGNMVSVVTGNTARTIRVGDVPDELHIVNEDLWVSCKGKPSYAPSGATKGKFVKIDLVTGRVSGELKFEQTSAFVNLGNSAISGTNLYYTIGTAIYKFDLTAEPLPETTLTLPETPLFDVSAQNISSIYGFAVHKGRIYVSNAFGFNVAGKVHIYGSGETGSTAGSLLNTTTVGVGPSAFYFNF